MNKNKSLFTILLLLSAIVAGASIKSITRRTNTRNSSTKKDILIDPQSNGYKLIWADEFNKDGLVDTQVWNFETGFVRNKEIQWYQPQNVRCENGYLVIEGKRSHYPIDKSGTYERLV